MITVLAPKFSFALLLSFSQVPYEFAGAAAMTCYAQAPGTADSLLVFLVPEPGSLKRGVDRAGSLQESVPGPSTAAGGCRPSLMFLGLLTHHPHGCLHPHPAFSLRTSVSKFPLRMRTPVRLD